MRRGLTAVVALLALTLVSTAAAGGPTMAVGATEEVLRQSDPALAKAQMDLAKLAGFDTVRVTEIWAPGQTRPTDESLAELRNVVASARLAGIRPYVSITNFGSRTTPLTAQHRSEFAQFAAATARALPTVRDYIIGNEPNLNRFWMPQFNPDGSNAAAPAYVALLAETYDALKAVSPTINVIGGAVSPRGGDRPGTGRDTHSPTKFIPDMGAAYRASGRTRPLMDMFGFHPYTDNSSQPPTFEHPNTTTVAIADYGKLVRLLGQAFDGTQQRGSTLPILYDEFGIESVIPAAKASLYSGNEPTTTRPVDERTQGDYYRQALALAFCQPNVRGILMFHTVDEPGLPAWQSGLFYADGTAKSSLPATRTAIGMVRRGIIARCPGMQLTVVGRIGGQRHTPTGRSFLLTCDIDCNYQARIQRLPATTTVRTVSGRAGGRRSVRVQFPPTLAPGTYRFSVRLVAPVNPGPTTTLVSAAFRVRPQR
jgi:hypothetical protein